MPRRGETEGAEPAPQPTSAATVGPADRPARSRAPAASVVPDIRYTRPQGGEQRATYFELFFDLVYVFAITQLSHHLLHELTWSGAAETALLGLAVYWAWNYTAWMTNWFDPETTAVRLVLAFVMLASLLMAVALPEGFGDRALLFASSYGVLQVGRNAFVVGVTPAGPFHRNFEQILAWSVLTLPLWVGGALVDDREGVRWGLWLVALGLDLLAPLVRYWVPGLGRTPMSEWAIEGGHFAERFQLFVIIVLGESIVVAGTTASGTELEAEVVIALGCVFVAAAALWWLYFGQVAQSAVRRLVTDEVPGQLGRDAYVYLHIPIVAGILLSAVGDELVVAHPTEDLSTAGAVVALGGPALYLLGVVVFGARIGRHQAWPRTVTALVLLAAIPLAAGTSGVVVAALSTALLVALVTFDHLGLGHIGLGFRPTAAADVDADADSGASRLPPA